MGELATGGVIALPMKNMPTSLTLRTRGLCRAFGGQAVLNNISLDLHRGEVVLLRGDNGSGKTTLLNILTGNLEPDAGVIEIFADGVEERFSFPRHWWESLNPIDHFTPERVANEGIGRTWQDIRLFSTQDLRSNLAVALPRQLGENPVWALFRRPTVRREEESNIANARAILAELGLSDRETSSADRISLGQAKRVAVARAIQAGAQILFLDEPLAGLDKPGIDQVLYLLDRLVRIRHITIVIVEHVFHIPRILDLASTVWTLTHGRLIVQTPAEVRSEMAHTIGDGLKPWVESMVGNEGKVIEHELARGAVLSVLKTASELSEEAILEIKGLVVYRGNRLVIGLERDGHVEGLSFSLRAGEIAVLHAPNGWGKTTLLEAIAGLLPISAGEIKIHGYPVQSLAAWDRFRLGLSLLQAKNNTFPNLTVKEMLCLAKIRSVPSHLQSFRDRRVVDLSGGEKQRLAITCALEPGHARLRLLDEPFSMLDHAAIQSLQQSLKPSVDTSTLIAVPSFQQY